MNDKTIHHLFSKTEIKARLDEIYAGEKEQNIINDEVTLIHNVLPKYAIPEERHRKIHHKADLLESLQKLVIKIVKSHEGKEE